MGGFDSFEFDTELKLRQDLNNNRLNLSLS